MRYSKNIYFAMGMNTLIALMKCSALQNIIDAVSRHANKQPDIVSQMK